MRQSRYLPLLLSVLLSGCATSALKMAPERHDRPWRPTTDAEGAIIAGVEAAPEPPTSEGYVLPPNHTLENLRPRRQI